MKIKFGKYFLFVLAMLSLFFTQGCAEKPELNDFVSEEELAADILSDSKDEDPEQDLPVEDEWAKFAESFDVKNLKPSPYDTITDEGYTLKLERSVLQKDYMKDIELSFSSDVACWTEWTYSMEISIDGSWYTVPLPIGFTEEPLVVGNGITETLKIPFSKCDFLPIGTYRIVKKIGSDYVAVEFEIVESVNENFKFDVSRLSPTKYPNAVKDSDVMYCEPSTVRKDSLTDINFYFRIYDGYLPVGGWSIQVRELEVLIDGVWYNALDFWYEFVPHEYETYILSEPEGGGWGDIVGEYRCKPLPLTTIYKNLPAGTYRIVDKVNGRYYYAEFEIVDSDTVDFDILELSDIEISSDCGYSMVLEPAVIVKSESPDMKVSVVSSESSEVAYFGYDFRLEVLKDGSWYTVRDGGYNPLEGILGVGGGSTLEQTIPYDVMFDELVPGTYRIIKDILGEVSHQRWNIAAEFEIVDSEEFSFDVSELSPSKYSDNIESDPTLLSLNPTVVKKDALVDIEISYGREDLFTIEEIDGELQTVYKYGETYFYLEVFIDGVWYDISSFWGSYIPWQYNEDYVYIFHDKPVLLADCPTQTFPLTTSFKHLPVGRYRIVKNVDGWKSAEFVIE